jgi:hypothetical protein
MDDQFADDESTAAELLQLFNLAYLKQINDSPLYPIPKLETT